MSSTPAEERLTIDAFMAKYGGHSGVELVNGRVVWPGLEPRVPTGCELPRFKRGVICYRAVRIFSEFIEGRRLGCLSLNDTFVRTGEDAVTLQGTDLLFFRSGRLPQRPPPDQVALPPDLAVIVRSASDRWTATLGRVAQYLQGGVRVVVAIDLSTTSAIAYRDDTVPKIFEANDELTLPDVLPGFAVPVSRFFADE